MKNSNPKTYHNHRIEPYFTFVKEGQKTIEGRLQKSWYKDLVVGDHIVIHNQDDETDFFEVMVKDLRKYESIKEMLEKEELKKILPDIETIEEGLEVYRKFYTEEQEREFGALAIEVERV